MTLTNIFYALILGLVEGLTEFIPVSSTGHLVLAKALLGLDEQHIGQQAAAFWDSFIILIQLGAILAVVVLYFQKLWHVVITLPSDASSRRFALSILIAFIPAVVFGLAFNKIIKTIFLESTAVVSWSLIIGGVVLLVVDGWKLPARLHDATRFPWLVSLGVGLAQVLAMIPGTSRSGATIVGGMLLGADKRAAAEFSFFLAIPTMLGAFTLDLLHNYKNLSLDQSGIIAIGFVASFVFGWIVIKGMLGFVQQRGYAIFAWWRIIVGLIGLFLIH